MNKLTTSLVAASVLVFAGCSKKPEEGTSQRPGTGSAMTPPPAPQAAAPKTLVGTELADKYKTCVGMVNDAKFEDFQTTCVGAGFKGHDYGDASEQNRDSLITWMKSMKAAMPDWKLTPQLILVSGRNLLAVELVTGTHTGALVMPTGTTPATNKKIGMLMFHRVMFDDTNMATEEWAYTDPLAMMGQLGVAAKELGPTRPVMDKGIDGAPIVVVSADDAKEKANLELRKKAVEAVNAGKFAELTAMMAPDAVESWQRMEKDTKGAKAIEASLKSFFGAFKDAKLTPNETFAAGDYVVETGKFTGTNDKDLGKIKKTGRTLDLDYAEINQIKDGKFVQVWRFSSGLVFAKQLGLMPPPGAPTTGATTPPAKAPAAPKASAADPTVPVAAPAAPAAPPAGSAPAAP